MSEDFTTRLQAQLREAALREEQRGALWRSRRLRSLVPPVSAGSLAAAAAVGVALFVGLWMVFSLRPEPAAPHAPRIVANVKLADSLGQSGTAAFGSLWLADTARGDILRVDPGTRRVTARIHAGAEVALAAGAGSVWAVVNPVARASGPLLRIDPHTARVVKRIALAGPAVRSYPQGAGVIVGRRIWVIGKTGTILVDPARNRVVRGIEPRDAYQFVDGALRGEELWLTTGDNAVTRYDVATGRRLAAAPWKNPGFLLTDGSRFIEVGQRSVALVDPRSGQTLWRSPVGQELRVGALAGGSVVVTGSDGRQPRDRVWAIDGRSGRVAPPTTVPEFGTVGMVASGRDVWLLCSNGRAVVVRP